MPGVNLSLPRVRVAIRGIVVACIIALAGIWTPVPTLASVQLTSFSVTSPAPPESASAPSLSTTSSPGRFGSTSPATTAVVPAHDPTVGTMSGQAGTDGGAASYSIPIVVPPGRAGMQPILAFSYNSRGGNGALGLAWSLSGTSSIHRCPQTPEQDGQTWGVSLSNSDRLCLDGQRLVVTNTATYGTSGAVYATEIDSHARITQYGGDLAGSATCFTVEQKDGRILHYGAVVSSGSCSTTPVRNSRIQVQASSVTKTLSWLVEKIEDRVSNNQFYTYANATTNPGFGPGEVLLAKVEYTGSGTSAGDRVVTINYVARTAAASVQDVTSNYLAGGLTMMTQALQSVVTSVNGTIARTYTPTYAASAYNARLLMTNLTECGAGGVCHPATHFSYNDSAPLYQLTSLAPLSNGLVGGAGKAVNPLGLNVIGDLDGDGTRETVVTVTDGVNANHSYLVQLTADRQLQSAVDMTSIGLSPLASQYGDVDGSGRAAVIETPQSVGVPQVLTFGVWNLGRGVVAPPGSNPFTAYASDIIFKNGSSSNVYVADFNGDGKPDVAVIGPVVDSNDCTTTGGMGVFVWLNKMGANTTLNATSALTFQPTSGTTTTPHPLVCLTRSANGFIQQTIDHVADFDGNGLPDIYLRTDTSNANGPVATHFDGVVLMVPTGNGGLSINQKSCSQLGLTDNASDLQKDQCNWFSSSQTEAAMWTDVNGDGLDDFVIARPKQLAPDPAHPGQFINLPTWRVVLNTGTGTMSATEIDTTSTEGLFVAGSTTAFRYAGHFPTMDVDGDGKPDLLVPSTGSSFGARHGFAAKMCTVVAVKMPLSGECPNTSASPLTQSTTTASGYCPVYSCPENPDSTTLDLPANNSGQGYPNEWNGLAAKKHYETGLGTDASTYYLSQLKFVQTGAASFSVTRIDTPIVSGLDAGQHTDDVFGDGMPDLVTSIGCANIPMTGTNNNGSWSVPTCSAVTTGSDNIQYGPTTLADGTAIAGLDTNPVLYASVNQGVSGSGGGSPARPAGAPKLNVRAASPNGIPLGLSLPTLPNLLYQATDGLGSQATWFYAPLSTPGGIPGTNLSIYSVTGTYSDSRHYYFQSAMPVVYQMTQSNGAGNGQAFGFRAAIYGYAEAMYNHFGRGFQGFHQIITETSDNNQQRVIRTTTVYNQKFPLAGKVDTVTTSTPLIDGTNNATVTYEKDTWICGLGNRIACKTGDNLTTPTGRYAPVLDTQTVQSYDMGTGAQYAEVDTVNAVSAGATSSGWDTNGNLLSQVVTRSDVGTPVFVTSHATTTTNTYAAPDTTNWWLNQLTQSSVSTTVTYDSTHTFPGNSATLPQTLTTAYTWNTDRTPQTKSVQPGVVNQESTTTYCYPSPSDSTSLPCKATSGATGTTSYGMPSSVQVCLGYLDASGNCKGASTDGKGDVANLLSPTRSTSFVYTKDGTSGAGDGYFVLTTTNAKGQIATTTHETNDGQVLNATDPNGVQTVTTYDTFGRATKIDHLDKNNAAIEPSIYVAYSTCLDASKNSGHCTAGNAGEEVYSLNSTFEATAAYSVTTTQSGYPTKVTWFDLLGRTVKQAHTGFDGTFIGALTGYDEMGQKINQSSPYFICNPATPPTGFLAAACSTPPFLTQWSGYDALNRPTKKTVPMGTEIDPAHGDLQTDYSYNGRTTTIVAHGTAGGTAPTGTTCPSGTNLCLAMTRSTNALGQLMQTSEVPLLKNATGSGYTATTLSTNFWLDAQGNLAGVKDAEGNNTTATYNALGQRTASSDPDQGSWTYNLDALGETLSQTDARGVVTTVNSRDALGRTTEQQQVPPASTPGVDSDILLDHWTYDQTGAIGHLDHVTRYRDVARTTPYNDPTLVVWNEAYTYDTQTRLTGTTTTVTENGVSTALVSSQDYDASGRPNTHSYPGGFVAKNTYTSYGQLQSLTNIAGTTTYWTATAQNEWDHVTGESFANGIAGFPSGGITGSHVDYRSTGQASKLSWTNQDTFTYGYDSFGNLVTQNRTVNASNGEAFSYDPLQRLTQAARTNGGNTVNYGYTASGNLAFKDDYSTNTSSSNTPAYTYASKNSTTNNCGPHAVNTVAMPGSTTATYQCDKNGNVITGTLTNVSNNAFTATFDPDNHPTQASRTTVGPIVEPCRSKTTPADSIFCDGYEKLTPTTSTGSTTWHYGTNGQRDYEFSSAGTRFYGPSGYERLVSGGVTKHIAELGPVIITRIGSTDSVTVVLRDRLGSTLDTIDSGQPITQRAFDAFAKARNGNMTDRPNGTLNLADTIHGFTTHTHADDVALVHMKGRVFDANLGRFLSVDPVAQGTHSQALNPYSYLGNNPLSGTDPTGYVGEVGCTGGAGGACEDPVANGTFNSDTIARDHIDGFTVAYVAPSGPQPSSSGVGGQGAGSSQVPNSPLIGTANDQSSQPNGNPSSGNYNSGCQVPMQCAQGSDSSGTQGATTLQTVQVTASVAAANQRLDDANKNFGDVAQGGFKSRHDARLAGAMAWVPDGLLTNREANWYVLDFSDGTFGYTYPHVGATNVAVVAPVSIDTVKLNQSNGATVTRADMNHNHLRGDMQFSGHDEALLRDPRYRSLDFWMWNSNGEAYMLRNSDSSGAISRSQQLEGTRMREFDIH